MPWSVAAAGISAAGSIGGGLLQSSNAGKAGQQAQRNLQMILPQMQANYVQGQNQLAPLITAGTEGTGATADLLGLNGPDAASAAMARYQTSPGYQWQMSEGLRGVDAGAAAKGMLRSGATLKGEDTFAQGLANSDFGQYYNRLAGLSTLGANAISTSITAGGNLISQEEGNATSQNTAVTNAANAQNSIIGNTATGLGNTVNKLLSDPNAQSAIKGLFGPSTGDLSNYGATPGSYQTAPGFNIGDATQNPNSYWV